MECCLVMGSLGGERERTHRHDGFYEESRTVDVWNVSHSKSDVEQQRWAGRNPVSSRSVSLKLAWLFFALFACSILVLVAVTLHKVMQLPESKDERTIVDYGTHNRGLCDAFCRLSNTISSAAQILTSINGQQFMQASSLWNPIFDGRSPAVIIRCASELDVSAAVIYARSAGFHAHILSGGHSSLGWTMCNDASCVVIDVRRLNSVIVNYTSQTATFGSGATSGEVAAALFPTFATNLPSHLGIGMGGYLTGGGLGMSTNVYGIACDSILSVRVVLADGSVVSASSAPEDPLNDLWWAVAGGGSGYGVVTEFTIKLHRPPEMATKFSVSWNSRDFQTVNDEFHSWLRISNWTSMTQVFFAYHPSSLVLVGIYHGSSRDVEGPLASELATAVPGGIMSVVMQDSYPVVYYSWADPINDVYRMGLYTFMSGLNGIPGTLVPKIQYWQNQSQYYCSNPLSSCSIHSLSTAGVASSINDNFNAWPHRQSLVDLVISVNARSNEAWTSSSRWGMMAWKDIRNAYTSWPNRMYINSPLDPIVLGNQWQTVFYGAHYSQLQTIKRKYDPNIVFNQTGMVQV